MTGFEPVQVHPCKNCGFPMRQYNPNSRLMVCESCGTRTGEGEQPPEYVPTVPFNPLFKLHEQFELSGDTWQVIGCQSYSGVVDEWDSEDKTWERTPWSYHTWWVLNAAREIAWIVQDQTGYSWSRKVPLKSGIPVGDKTYEVGDWSLVSAVGEFSYTPPPDERLTTYEKKGYSIEILRDAAGNQQEIEAFTALPIKPLDLLQGFGKTEVIERYQRIKQAMYAAFASMVLLLLGFMLLQGFEQELFKRSDIIVNSPMTGQAIPVGHFTLEKQGLVEFAFIGSTGGGDGSFEAEIKVQDSDKTTVAELPLSLWRESGYDDEGSWTESQYGDAPRVILPGGNGDRGEQYELVLQAEGFQQWSSVVLSATVTRNVVSFTPIVFGMVLALALALLLGRKLMTFLRRATGVTG